MPLPLLSPNNIGSPCRRCNCVSAASLRPVNDANTSSLYTMQFWKISVSDAPPNACACSSTCAIPTLSVSIARAKNFAPEPSANCPGDIGVSIEPPGLDGEAVPTREVGEYCPFVRPYISLLNNSIFRPTLRLSACRRWLPPIESPSPSPVTTQTSSSGFASFNPVAIAGARP